MTRRAALALSVVAILGCSAGALTGADGLTATIADDARALSTDSAVYTARRVDAPWPGVEVYGFTAVTRYVNPASQPVYLWTCRPDDRSPIYSVVSAGGSTSSGVAYNTFWACVGHDRPIRVAPGEAHVDTLHLRGPNAFDGITHQPIDQTLEGRFQIMFTVQRCPSEAECPIPDDRLTHSNEFTVRVAR